MFPRIWSGNPVYKISQLSPPSLLRATRPTAQNLFYAIDRVLECARPLGEVEGCRARAVDAAQRIADEDALAGERIGEIAQPLIPPSSAILTHCNAGWLAFADWGSALAPIYRAHRDGKGIAVFATETRPRAQGAKLTAWELAQEQVPFTLVPDTAVGSLMQRRLVQLVIVGGLIVVFLIAEPHGLAQLWRVAKEKLRLWPFPH